MADSRDVQHGKIFDSIKNLSQRILTLAEGKFTGTVYYELNMQQGGFQQDLFGSRGRMTPKQTEEDYATRVPDAK
jgi:hypothetical protein